MITALYWSIGLFVALIEYFWRERKTIKRCHFTGINEFFVSLYFICLYCTAWPFIVVIWVVRLSGVEKYFSWYCNRDTVETIEKSDVPKTDYVMQCRHLEIHFDKPEWSPWEDYDFAGVQTLTETMPDKNWIKWAEDATINGAGLWEYRAIKRKSVVKVEEEILK